MLCVHSVEYTIFYPLAKYSLKGDSEQIYMVVRSGPRPFYSVKYLNILLLSLQIELPSDR